jgi:hypothetical protein
MRLSLSEHTLDINLRAYEGGGKRVNPVVARWNDDHRLYARVVVR